MSLIRLRNPLKPCQPSKKDTPVTKTSAYEQGCVHQSDVGIATLIETAEVSSDLYVSVINQVTLSYLNPALVMPHLSTDQIYPIYFHP